MDVDPHNKRTKVKVMKLYPPKKHIECEYLIKNPDQGCLPLCSLGGFCIADFHDCKYLKMRESDIHSNQPQDKKLTQEQKGG